MCFLCKYNAAIDLRANRITLSKPSPRTAETKAALTVIRVSAYHVRLPPRSSLLVSIETDNVTRSEVLLEGNNQLLLGKGYGVARGLTNIRNSGTKFFVTNFQKETKHLTKGTVMGHVEEPLDSAAPLSLKTLLHRRKSKWSLQTPTLTRPS